MFRFFAKNWFLLALIGLFLAVVPGIILVSLAACGLDRPVNAWLLENFQIDYSLAVSPWLILVLLLVPLAIILLYFLKLKRKPLQVPSTFLWRKSIEDMHVNSLLQWLRQNVLLVLQLLLVLFLIYATLGLRFHGSSGQGAHYIVLIDNSASMSATDVKPSRLELAKSEALNVIDAAGDYDFGMVISFNSKATTVQTYTNNRIKLREAVNSIEQTAHVTRLDEALTLIDGLANPAHSTEDASVRPGDEKVGEERTFVKPVGVKTSVHLFSDGRIAKIPDAVLNSLSAPEAGHTSRLGNVKIKYHRIGKAPSPLSPLPPGGERGRGEGVDSANNLGIVDFHAVRFSVGKGKDKIDKLHAVVHVKNFRDEAAQLALTPGQSKAEVTVIMDVKLDGVKVDSRQQTLKLDARARIEGVDTPGEAMAPFELPAFPTKSNLVLHARLDGVVDDFALDNEAWFVMGSLRKAKVLLIGPRNHILEKFFAAAADKQLVSWTRLDTADLTTDSYRKPASSGEVDLVIFDRCAPADEKDMPQANTFFIDQPPPPWQRGDKVRNSPLLITARPDDRFMRRISSLWDVGVAEAFVFDLQANLSDKFKSLPEKERRILPEKITRILEADRRMPLLFTLPREPYVDLVMTFAILDDKGNLNTNWPGKLSFPLFLQNIVNNLGNVESVGHNVQPLTVHPGDPMVMRPEAGVKSLTVTSPRGTSVTLQRGNRPEFVFGETEQPGIYQVVRDDGMRRCFAVNLLDSGESTIDPLAELGIGGENIEAGQADVYQPWELWKWILVVALVLLLVEWFFYNQRVAI